jgi:hypothetical protein
VCAGAVDPAHVGAVARLLATGLVGVLQMVPEGARVGLAHFGHS